MNASTKMTVSLCGSGAGLTGRLDVAPVLADGRVGVVRADGRVGVVRAGARGGVVTRTGRASGLGLGASSSIT